MATNSMVQLASTTSDINATEAHIAELENKLDTAYLGSSSEDIAVLKLELTKFKAVLGQFRNQEAFWRQEVNEGKTARKNQGELAKG